MADTNTLAGLLLLNDANMSEVVATDVLNDAPVIRRLVAQMASQGGTTHKYERRLTAPGAGFRLVNEGITNATGTIEQVTVDCALMDATVRRDKAVAMAYRKGAQAYMDRELGESLKEAFFGIEKAIFRSNINKQFTGLPGNAFFDQITVDGQVVNEGGSGGRSVWLLRTAENGVSIIAGNDGRVEMAAEDAEVTLYDSGSRPYTGLQRTVLGWFGLQVGSKYDAVRICNIDGTTGNVLTDDAIAAALALFPASRQANMIVMSRTSLKELQQSRTATNPTGAPAPFPQDSFGIPIVVTDALPENESALNTTSTTTTTSAQA